MRAGPLGLRLFLEGVEVPVISAQVVIQPSRPATAAIQIVPLDSALDLLPRTLVHLFYMEKIEEGDEDQARAYGLNRLGTPDTSYKLLFSGEVIGYNYAKTPTSRQLVLQCMDLSSYWDTCYQWFADYSVHGTGLTDKAHTFVQAGSSLFDNIAGGTTWVLGNLLNSRPRSPEYKNVSGLLGGIIHVLEAIGGIRPRAQGFKGYSGTNDFFTIAELRYNLLGMVGAVEKDKTSTKVYASKAFRSWLRSGMTSAGNLISFRDVIRQVSRWIFHDVYPNPSPYFVEGGKVRTYAAQTSVFTDSASGKQAQSHLKKAQESMNTVVTALKTVSTSLDFVEGSLDIAGRAGGAEGTAVVDALLQTVPKDLVKSDQVLRVALNDLSLAKRSIESAKTDDSKEAAAKVDAAITDLKLLWRDVSDQVKNRNASAAKVESQMLALARSIYDQITSILRGTKKRGRKTLSAHEGAHMYTQLILPETFFVPPPRCNVLFPDQYYSFSYNRNFLREVTRLSCHSGLSLIAGRRGAKLLGRHYFAPSIRGTEGKTLYATLSQGARILLPHEVHSGIVPKFEWVTDGHRWGTKAAKERGYEDKHYQAGKVGYIQRLAHYQFYQHRWLARSMSIEALFNPRLVLGLPAVIIDRGAIPPTEQVKISGDSGLTESDIPTQFLGKIAAITHNVHQGGGQTAVALSHCRTHRGTDDEFLNLLMREKKRKTTYDITIEPLVLAQSSAAGGKKRKGIIDLIDKYARNNLTRGKYVPKWGTVKNINASSATVLLTESQLGAMGLSKDLLGKSVVFNDLTADQRSILASSSTFVSSSEGIIDAQVNTDVDASSDAGPVPMEQGTTLEDSFSTGFQVMEVAKSIVVTFDKWHRTGEYQRSDLTIEDALRPGWYSDVWKKDNISNDVYMPLLGVRAITDDSALGSELLGKEGVEPRGTIERKHGPVDEVEFQTGEGRQVVLYSAQSGSLEDAIDGLAIIYGLVRWNDQDVHQFIDSYTHRPIANMIEVMGSQDLMFNDSGDIEDPSSMIEGFHSRAFGDYNADMEVGDDGQMKAGKESLKNLAPGIAAGTPIDLDPIIIRGKRPPPVPPHLDPRGRARARVKAYADELTKKRGLLGT